MRPSCPRSLSETNSLRIRAPSTPIRKWQIRRLNRRRRGFGGFVSREGGLVLVALFVKEQVPPTRINGRRSAGAKTEQANADREYISDGPNGEIIAAAGQI